jgi:hypothetical protein
MPKFFVSREQARTEYAGLLAEVGYSSVVMGSTSFSLKECASRVTITISYP